jgi:hypothetical protein
MKGDLAVFAFLGLLAGGILYTFSPLEPDWGMTMEGCETGKPDGFAWTDAGPGAVISLAVEVDHNEDGKADEFWRAEGAGKVALYWPGLPGLRYRANAIVNGEGYGPTHWFWCP